MMKTDFAGRAPGSSHGHPGGFGEGGTGLDKAAVTSTLVAKVAQMPRQQALILQLLYVEGLTPIEVGAVLDIHPIDVCIAKHRGLAYLTAH